MMPQKAVPQPSWRPPARLGVGATDIEIRAPNIQGHAGLIKRREQGLGEQFITQERTSSWIKPQGQDHLA